MHHNIKIKGYDYLSEVVIDIKNLRYDHLYFFLNCLSYNIENDSEEDYKRNRKKLAKQLLKASKNIYKASKNIKEAWKIAKPLMNKIDIHPKVSVIMEDR
jgi:hypothetical protein